jgi:signal transduction histidine kinase
MREKPIIHDHSNIDTISIFYKNIERNSARGVTELKQKDLLRRDLIANVAHDLRTPLSSMRGYLETLLIKNTEIGSEERIQYLQIILSSTIQLSNLIDELFKLSRLEAKQVQLKRESFSLVDLVQDVVLKLMQFAVKNNIQLLVELVDDIPSVYADIGLIERVITNLLDNAIRYTPPGGIVKVMLTRKSKAVRLCLVDTGCGIAAEDLPFVFDRYYRRKKKTPSGEKGTGLGLAITKKILELHNSYIQVESKLGVGTKFYFDLPVFGSHRDEFIETNNKGKPQ